MDQQQPLNLAWQGQITKIESLPGKPTSFEEGYWVKGLFEEMPTPGASFWMWHLSNSAGKDCLGVFLSSRVESTYSSQPGLIEFTTCNSRYRLEYSVAD